MVAIIKVLVGLAVVAQASCATSDEINTRADASTQALALRLGVPGCRLSDPLQVDDILRYARREGMAVRSPIDMKRRLTEGIQSGAEIRLIDCRGVDRRGLVEGARSFAVIMAGKISYVAIDEILN
jgi:hypothetical protein